MYQNFVIQIGNRTTVNNLINTKNESQKLTITNLTITNFYLLLLTSLYESIIKKRKGVKFNLTK